MASAARCQPRAGVSGLASPGSLLRAWRTQLGWTRDDVAQTVRFSAAAVGHWETGTRRMPMRALHALDFAWVAEGCLSDLARAIGSPRQSGEASWGAGPRRQRGHVFMGEPGPAWAWVRPASAERVAGYSRLGLLGMRFDEVTGRDGLFLILPYASALLPLRVTLSEPGWVDFGRGEVPFWLERPVLTGASLADVEVILTRHPIIDAYMRVLRARDRGDPATLRDRLRALVGPQRWDALESQIRRGGELPGYATMTDAGEPRPPGTAAERAALHRRLREGRAMSQTDAAAAVSAVLAADGTPGRVTRQQIRDYEDGRVSRVRQLPALLDMAYGAFGWSCWEPVRVTRDGHREYLADIPAWWVGPVGVTAIPARAFPSSGRLVLTSRNRQNACPLPAPGSGALVTFEYLALPGETALRMQVPPGWHLHAHLGHGAGAVDADTTWHPPSAEAVDRLFEISTETWLRMLGRSRADLDRILQAGPSLAALHSLPTPSPAAIRTVRDRV